jgi:DNA (cytosine-5)-methyltransferase 1
MTYKPLTESRGEALLMSYLEGFHAKTSVPQEKESASMETDQECGEKWRGSFVKYDPDSSLWRTHQCSLLGDLDEFSETWPQWGLMRDGECWEQLTLERHIRGTESGLSPNGVDSFHTPNTTGLDGGSNSRRALRKKIEKLPTPQATDHRSKPMSASWKAKGGVNFSLANPEIQMNWPTPNARDWKDSQTAGNRKSPGLGVMAHVGNTIDGGQLNPDWVEWLMNWPIKWSDLNGFNKQEFQRWQEASAEAVQGIGKMRTMWWYSDPSQTPLGQQPLEQPKQQHSNSLPEMSWDASCERKMERSQQGSDLSLLRKDFYIQEAKRKDLQQRMREQTCLDEAQIVPRVSKSVAARVDRLKAIGNGQVPLCAATAWRVLNAGWI